MQWTFSEGGAVGEWEGGVTVKLSSVISTAAISTKHNYPTVASLPPPQRLCQRYGVSPHFRIARIKYFRSCVDSGGRVEGWERRGSQKAQDNCKYTSGKSLTLLKFPPEHILNWRQASLGCGR